LLAHCGSKNTEDRGRKTESRSQTPDARSQTPDARRRRICTTARTPNPEARVPAWFTS
jgi:hypothetical protein